MTTQPPASPLDSAMTPTETRLVPVDLSRLVIAARIVAYEDQSPEALKALDIAAEKFAGLVPWEDEPDREEAPEGALLARIVDARARLDFTPAQANAGLLTLLDDCALALRAQPQPEQGGASGEARESIVTTILRFDPCDNLSAQEAEDLADAILALIRPAPVAGEGPEWKRRLSDVHAGRSVGDVYAAFPSPKATFRGDIGHALSTTPARSEAHAQEAAIKSGGKPDAWLRRSKTSVGAYLTPGTPEAGVSVLPLYAHPAADDDRLRVAVEALEPFAAHPDFHAGDDWPVTFVNDEERVPGVTAGDFRRAAKALAALKAEVKK